MLSYKTVDIHTLDILKQTSAAPEFSGLRSEEMKTCKLKQQIQCVTYLFPTYPSPPKQY